MPVCLKVLSQDISFIQQSLTLAEIKYCQVSQVNIRQVMNITSTDISAYLQTLVKRTLYKVFIHPVVLVTVLISHVSIAGLLRKKSCLLKL